MTSFHESPWELFPKHRHLCTEESGNDVIVDTTSGDDGPVLGLWHDPPAIVVLAKTEQEFRVLVPSLAGDDTMPLPAAIHARLDAALAWSKANVLPREDAGMALGAGFSDWISTLPAEARICDLRAREPGTGFELGSDTTIARHPTAAVFACLAPAKKPGLFRWLFG